MDGAADPRDQAERILRAARETAGVAAYHYFFRDATPHARAAYLAALAAETDAELLLHALRDEPEG